MTSSSLQKWVVNGITLAVLSVFRPACAEDEFNLRILELDTPLENTATLRNFIQDNGLLPGKYFTTILWGKEVVDKRSLNVVLSDDKQRLMPELTKADLRGLGVKVDSIAGLKALDDSALVTDITPYIADAHLLFNQDDRTLELVIPQIYCDQAAAGTISPQHWNDGETAGWTSYQLSVSQQQSDHSKTSSTWLGLDSGINVGPWRLRNHSAFSNGNGWEAMNTSVQRDIKRLRSQLEIGQTWTNGELFDSVEMTGLRLESDSAMLPGSQQGFAPVVQGIANSDATVTIKQNGYTIYQTHVAPGPFAIHDLSQVTAGADLEVTIQEADGSEHSFIQASASVPILQREGALKYALAAGKYRSNEGEDEPSFGQGTVLYGLPAGITLYAGGQGASFYHALLGGVGADLGRLGSASVDITAAHTSDDDGRDPDNGLSWRAQYSKDIPDTSTTLALASYRYSTSGFYTFQEAIDRRSSQIDDGIYSYRWANNRRSRLQMNLSQKLGRWGSLNLNSYQQDYWGLSGHERSVSAGVSSSWKDITWSLNYSMTRTPDAESDRQVALSVSIPLSHWMPNAWATYSVNSASGGYTSHQVGIGGTALENNTLSYNLQQSYTSNNTGYGASLSGRYRGSAGEMGLGYSYGGDNRQWNASAQGTIVAHEHGITFGQRVQDAFAVVHIPQGAGIQVQNGRGIVTDRFGNAIVPTLTAYRHNLITVNTGQREDIDIESSTQDVVPTKGAMLPVSFDARVGIRGLITLLFHGKPIPFGAVASLDGSTAIVGDGGEVWLTGLRDPAVLTVQWGEGNEQHCTGKINVPEKVPGIFKSTVDCR